MIPITFAEPAWFWLVGLLIIDLFLRRGNRPEGMRFSSIHLFALGVPPSWRLRLRFLPALLRTAMLFLLILAVARPMTFGLHEAVRKRSIHLVLVLDVSGSMGKHVAVKDGLPITRLLRVRDGLKQLLLERFPFMSVSIVSFAVEAKEHCPATTEMMFAAQVLDELQIDLRDNRTDLGAAIAVAVDSALRQTLPSAIVLFSDGAQRVPNTLGPIGGARLAQAFELPIFVVDAGWPETFTSDRQQLEQMALLTGGAVIDPDNISQLGDHINRRIKTTDLTSHSAAQQVELFQIPLMLAVLCLALEILLRRTWLRIVPSDE